MTTQPATRPELVVALVCPLGAPIDVLQDAICDELRRFGYHCETIHISALLKHLTFWTPPGDTSEATRIAHHQNMAFKFRTAGNGDAGALGRAAIAEIRAKRLARSQHPDREATACAYILRQLKHPEEIKLLRAVYGQSLVVVAGHAPEDLRVRALANVIALKSGRAAVRDDDIHQAEKLIHVDEKEDHPDDDEARFGQNTRDTFPLADFFVSLANGKVQAVARFFELLFGHPFHTPTPEEVAMHQANAMALRSSDERRQVGAVVVRRTKRSPTDGILDSDIIASGMNEVPRRQGGFYWHDESPDGRDQATRQSNQGVDLEDRIKLDALREIAERLKGKAWLSGEYAALDEPVLAQKLLQLLKRTQFMDISEFMRQVHAEMAALVDAAKRGVAVRGGEMYVTTFPCHNCAKHIIAAGITKVVYLEPYPKSRAEMLHREELSLDPLDPAHAGDRVSFVPFTGVAPRQFARLFAMAGRGRRNGLGLDKWKTARPTLSPAYVTTNAAYAYTQSERQQLDRLPSEYRWDRAKLCP